MDYWLIFITGLTVGGLSCMAVQGGLLTSSIAGSLKITPNNNLIQNNTLPVLSFLVTKLFAHILLGFGLGFLGQILYFSDSFRLTIQIVAGLYMVAIALNLLNVHPIFRYAIIQPPKFLTKKIKSRVKNDNLFTPAILGAMTILIPCGTTLAMETLAISSGSPIVGGLILGLFTLGSSPIFFVLGFMTSLLSTKLHQLFFKIAGLVVLYLAIISINGALVAVGSSLSLQNLATMSPIEINLTGETGNYASDSVKPKIIDGVQVFDIDVYADGYSPSFLQVKKNQPVRLNLHTNGVYTCAQEFRIPNMGIVKSLQPVGTDSVEFIPIKSGDLMFTCSMGMYSGKIEVID